MGTRTFSRPGTVVEAWSWTSLAMTASDISCHSFTVSSGSMSTAASGSTFAARDFSMPDAQRANVWMPESPRA